MKYYCNWIWSLNLFFCIGTIAFDVINKRYYAVGIWGVVIALLFVTRTLAMRNMDLEDELRFVITGEFNKLSKELFSGSNKKEEEKEKCKDENN